MTQLLLYHARFLSPSARHFLLRPFSHCSLKLCLLFIFLECVCYQQILSFFSYISVSSVSTFLVFFSPPGLCSAAFLSPNVLSVHPPFIYVVCKVNPSYLSLILPFVLFHPISLPPAVAEDDKPPYTVTRLPWTRAAVWSE